MDKINDQLNACIQRSRHAHFHTAMQATLSLLTDNNQEDITSLISLLPKTTSAGTDAYMRVLKCSQRAPFDVAEVMVTAWLSCDRLTKVDRQALTILAEGFGLDTAIEGDALRQRSQATAGYLAGEMEDLLAEGQKLLRIESSLPSAGAGKISKLPTQSRLRPYTPMQQAHSKPHKVHLPSKTRPKFNASRRDVPPKAQEDAGEPQQSLQYPPPMERATRGLNPDLEMGISEMKIHDDLRKVPSVVDLLLDSIFAACDAMKLELLKGCPIRSFDELRMLLNHLPSMSELSERLSRCKDNDSIDRMLQNTLRANVPSLLEVQPSRQIRQHQRHHQSQPFQPSHHYSTLPTLHPPKPFQPPSNWNGPYIREFLNWVCTTHKCTIVPATGNLEIPFFQNVPQFLITKQPLYREEVFATHLQRAHGRFKVVFHGTSLSRLYPILRHGLQNCTGTTLMQNGAGFGSGIYSTDHAQMAAEYASGNAVAPTTSFHPQQHRSTTGRRVDTYRGLGVLLGCELAMSGGDMKVIEARGTAPGVFVLRDPGMVIVRYVFLIGRRGWWVPPPRSGVERFLREAFEEVRKGRL